jgi:hypothetical protein
MQRRSSVFGDRRFFARNSLKTTKGKLGELRKEKMTAGRGSTLALPRESERAPKSKKSEKIEESRAKVEFAQDPITPRCR